MEAASITWRPLGRLLVEQGLLTGSELERALARQQETGERLGETIVKCGFVSGPELASALAAQYGIELTTEKGFGTGLRSEIQRRHESDRRRIVQLVPEPASDSSENAEAVEAAEIDSQAAEALLLAQLEEQWAKLAAAEESLAERERELEQLTRRHSRRRSQLARFANRVRERDRRLEHRLREFRQLEEVNHRLRAQIDGLRHLPDESPPAPSAPAAHLLFVQLDERYELVSREGPPPPLSTPLSLPDVDDGIFVVAGSRESPLPGDSRPCVFVQRG